jgi:alpha-beta hydrolase superfamily lysophospholipase
MTDPESSEMLDQRAASSDKSLQWVDNVFHDLMHEKPTSARVCAAITDWFLTRSDRTKPKAKSSARGGAK